MSLLNRLDALILWYVASYAQKTDGAVTSVARRLVLQIDCTCISTRSYNRRIMNNLHGKHCGKHGP